VAYDLALSTTLSRIEVTWLWSAAIDLTVLRPFFREDKRVVTPLTSDLLCFSASSIPGELLPRICAHFG
jgi:hypothetical protein